MGGGEQTKWNGAAVTGLKRDQRVGSEEESSGSQARNLGGQGPHTFQ